jgi:hypothetical protein
VLQFGIPTQVLPLSELEDELLDETEELDELELLEELVLPPLNITSTQA